MKTPVAIKQIPQEKLTKNALEDFTAEAKTMQKIPPHPNVVTPVSILV